MRSKISIIIAGLLSDHFCSAELRKKHRKEHATLQPVPACPPGHGPVFRCPYGYAAEGGECCKIVDSALQWACIVGTYDAETLACVTEHKRPGLLECPPGYTLKGTVCEGPLGEGQPCDHATGEDVCKCKEKCLLGGSVIARQSSRSNTLPLRYPSFLAVPKCEENETPDALDGTCIYKERWAPRPVCAGEIVQDENGDLLCRVRVIAAPKLVCSYPPLQPSVETLDILTYPDMLKDYFRQQQRVHLIPSSD